MNNKELIKDCLGKLNHLNSMSWDEINKKHQTEYSNEHLRKLSYGFKLYADALSEDNIGDNETLIEIKKQKVQLTDMRTNINAKIRDLARTENVINLM